MKKKKKREFASVGGTKTSLPAKGDRDFLDGSTSGYKFGDTPALNTAIKRFGSRTVKLAIRRARAK